MRKHNARLARLRTAAQRHAASTPGSHGWAGGVQFNGGPVYLVDADNRKSYFAEDDCIADGLPTVAAGDVPPDVIVLNYVDDWRF